MSEDHLKGNLEDDRGSIVTSVETDETRQLASNAFNKALSASAAAALAQTTSDSVAADATNAFNKSLEAISLAEAAQLTANDAISKYGGEMLGDLILPPYDPISDYSAAPKIWVETYVDDAIELLTGGTTVTDIMDALDAKADLEYVDSKFALKLAKSTFDAFEATTNARLDAGEAAVVDLQIHQVPYGAIIMWSGFSANIPSGWKLCNGLYGTPDLRNRFIMGATGDGGANPAHSVGGGASTTTSASGAHSHTGTISTAGAHSHTVGDTALTINQMPAHDHQADFTSAQTDFLIYDPGSTVGTAVNIQGSASGIFRRTRRTYSRGSGAPHSHSLNSAGGHTHTATLDDSTTHTHSVPYSPPSFYSLCFIQLVPAGTPP